MAGNDAELVAVRVFEHGKPHSTFFDEALQARAEMLYALDFGVDVDDHQREPASM